MMSTADKKSDIVLNETEAHVVRYLRRAAKPSGAYDIQNALGIRHPTTVYRALERLARCGFVHRLESQNAFVACHDPDKNHNPGFIVCSDCGAVTEISTEAALAALRTQAREQKFKIEKTTIELLGRCDQCSSRVQPPTRHQ
jgi:Fur family zinc uptake transcriptional regulator